MLFLKTVYLEYTILPTPTSHTPMQVLSLENNWQQTLCSYKKTLIWKTIDENQNCTLGVCFFCSEQECC